MLVPLNNNEDMLVLMVRFKTVTVSSDDSASAASSMEVTDRIASLEQRVQMQEDEIQLLKSALADVVRRLNVSEEQQAMGSRRGPTKGLSLSSSSPLLSSFLPARVATVNMLRVWRNRPRYDEKDCFSRQQCWEVR